MVKDQIPFLKALTTLDNVLEDVDADLESTNFLESLNYFSQYIVFNDFFTTIAETFDLKDEEVEIGEGFVAKNISDEYELEPTTKKVHTFSSVLFRLQKITLTREKILAIISKMVYYGEYVSSIEIDVSSGWTQIFINEDPVDECEITLGS